MVHINDLQFVICESFCMKYIDKNNVQYLQLQHCVMQLCNKSNFYKLF